MNAAVWIVIGVLILIIILFLLVTNIRIVPQAHAFVLERLGGYKETWSVGLHFKVPILDRVAKKVSLKEQVVDFEPQAVITKDNVTMQIDSVVFFTVTDPKLFTYGVVNPLAAIENLASTTLRNIIGELDLDQTLTSRDIINAKMRSTLDDATDAWGIKVNRVEVKNILPPKDIREAMERQMRAEREKREKILLAEGSKQSAILIAEGNKEASILNAEAEKQVKIKNAEGQAQAIINIKEAEARGIILVREAEAKGLKAIKDVAPDNAVLTLKSYEALAKVADGKATKLIIPSKVSDLTSLANVIKESVTETPVEETVSEASPKKEAETQEKAEIKQK